MATAATIKTVSTRTTPAMPEEAASSAETREGKVHLLLQRDLRLWQACTLYQGERSERATTAARLGTLVRNAQNYT